MPIKYSIIRSIIRAGIFSILSVNKKAHTIMDPSEDRFGIFYSRLPEKELDDLIRVYIKIFSEYPWNEKWRYDDVLYKLQREVVLSDSSFLTVLAGSKELPVSGFSWGALVDLDSLPQRIAPALGTEPKSLEDLIGILKRRRMNNLLYFDEFAIDKHFRGNISHLRFLLIPGLELGHNNGISQTMFWSTPGSKITSLATYMGYEPIYKKMIRGREIIFLFHPDFYPLLKMAQSMNDRDIVFLMRIASFLQGRRNYKA